MARVNQLVYIIGFLLYFAMYSRADWCIAKIGAPHDKLQAYVNQACGRLNCKEVNPGGICYEPNTIENHSSYVLDLDYRKNGVCNSELGTPAITDPSYGRCKYP